MNRRARGEIITGYRVLVSRDGRRFRPVAAGSWNSDIGVKTARWRATRARYVRLVATASPGGGAAAAELGVVLTPGMTGG